MRTHHSSRSARITAAILFGALLAFLVAIPGATAASTRGGSITRSETIARFEAWIRAGVMYSQNTDRSTWASDGDGHVYRPDCSGSVSMAWHLNDSYTTWQLQPSAAASANLTTAISWGDLLPGDALVINSATTNHVVLFHRWVDSGHTRMEVYHESGTGTPAHASVWSPGTYAGYTPMRYNRIVEDAQQTDRQLQQVAGAAGTGWNKLPMVSVSANSTYSAVYMGGAWPQVMVNDNGVLFQVFGDSEGWHKWSTTITLPVGAEISAVNMGGTWPQVFVVQNGRLRQIWGQTSGWVNADTGVTVPSGTRISAVNMGGTWPQVMANENGVLYQIAAYANSWHNDSTGISLAAGTGISAVNMGGTWPQVLTVSGGVLRQIVGQSGGWVSLSTGVGVSSGSTLSAVNTGGTWPVIMANESGRIVQISGTTSGWAKAQTTVSAPAGQAITAVYLGGSWPQVLLAG